MKTLDRLITSVLTGGFVAEALPPVPLPKPPKGPQGVPSHRTTVAGSASALRKTERGLLTTDRLVARNARTTAEALRQLSYSSPDMSSSIFAMLRTGIPEQFTVVARDMEGIIDPDATSTAHALLRRLTFLGNVDGSYGSQMGIQSLSESLGRELLLYGALSGEVALDKARVPASLNAISVTKLKWYDEDQALRPVQEVGGQEISLDIPTFIYVAADQDLLEAYAGSCLEAAQQPILADLDFNNDLRRALKRAVLPRLLAAIDSEAVKKGCPPEILNDPEAFAKYKNDLIDAVQQVVNSAAPEDALVSFSEVDYDIMDGGQDPSAIIERVQKVLNSKLATALKTMPVVLGHGSSANASSTESLLFLKSANMVRIKLNEFYSRALTVALRVMGIEAYVEFKYAELDLRPKAELEAYKSMEQSRILDLLSLGFYSDEEASVLLTGNLPPPSYKPLSGTMFRSTAAGAAPAGAAQPGTAASGTSAMKKETPEQTKTQPRAESEVSVEDVRKAYSEGLAAVQDMSYAMARNANRAVEVTVEPSQMHLQLAQEGQPAKSFRIERDAEGRFVRMVQEEA